MIRTFKVEIKPTTKQREQFAKAFGTRRWCWNWALATYEKTLKETGKFLTAFDLDKILNELRRTKPEEYGWIGEVNTMVKSDSLNDFGLSVKAWCKHLKEARKAPTKVDANKGKPKFKKKGFCQESFRLFNKNPSAFKIISDNHFNTTWTRAYGRMSIKTTENISFLKDADIKTMTIIMKCGKYFMCLTYEKANRKVKQPEIETVIGCDLGIKHEVVTFDGEKANIFDLPSSIKRFEHVYDLRNRKLSSKQYGSKSYLKQKQLCDKAAAKQANIRKDFLHKLTTYLVQNYHKIMIDDFSFKGYVATQKNARHAYRVAPCTLKEMLAYKSELYGNDICFVARGTPTTQTCSHCGHVLTKDDKLALSQRTYECKNCGSKIDRDVNSAINVYKLAKAN